MTLCLLGEKKSPLPKSNSEEFVTNLYQICQRNRLNMRLSSKDTFKEPSVRYGFNHLSDDDFVALCKELNKNKGLLLIGAIRELPPKLAAFSEWRKGLTYMSAYA